MTSSYRTHTVIYIRTERGARRDVPTRSWLYTCVVPVSARCANAHLLLFGGDLVPENTAFILVYKYAQKYKVRVLFGLLLLLWYKKPP